MEYQLYVGSWKVTERNSNGVFKLSRRGNVPVGLPEYIPMTYVTTNEAEYLTIMQALMKFLAQGRKQVTVFSSNRLIVNQIQGRWETKSCNLVNYRRECAKLLKEAEGEIKWMPFGRLIQYCPVKSSFQSTRNWKDA